jgi:molecular chaperone DnaK (HSP70)
MSLVLDSNYTERAIAVFGETKLYSKKLLEMGGKFNMNLNYRLDKNLIKTTRSDGKEPGWIFPKTKLSTIEAFVKNPPKVTEEKIEETKTKESKVTEDNDKIMLSREQFMNLVSTVNRLEQEVALLKNKVLGSSSTIKVEADKSEKVSNVRKQPKKVIEETSDDEEDAEDEEELMEQNTNKKGPSLLRR